MQFQIQKRGDRQIAVQPEFQQVSDDVIIGSTSLRAADGRTQERFQVITLRGGKISDMQECTSRRQAERSPVIKRPPAHEQQVGDTSWGQIPGPPGQLEAVQATLAIAREPLQLLGNRHVERDPEAPPRKANPPW